MMGPVESASSVVSVSVRGEGGGGNSKGEGGGGDTIARVGSSSTVKSVMPSAAVAEAAVPRLLVGGERALHSGSSGGGRDRDVGGDEHAGSGDGDRDRRGIHAGVVGNLAFEQ